MNQVQVQKNKFSLSNKLKVKRNEFLNLNIPKVIKYFATYLKKINGVNNYENPDELEDFGPIILSNDEDKHSKRIKYAIDNPNILNLALTGPLGSGKSTILKTFEDNFREYKCLNISLATFDKKTLDTEKIEHNILKQLFYSVEHKQIPESRFKRIENLSGIKLKTLFFILWLCSLSYFLDVDFFNDLIKTLHLNFHFSFLGLIYGLYFISYSSALVFNLMTFVLNFKLTKFKFKDFDFDNDQDKKTINFENEIDEILYFFERNPIEIVFFQDLDRFNESEIFIKLREINNLLNNYEPIKKKRKITFIYAVCDDIFKENERAKFFDFIIPVIPVINYTSSSSKLLTKLNSDIESKKLSRDFIDDVSLFLNDYRTIKSIYNEYQIYKNIIGKQLDNYNNLLAMMIYKNIEPTDFDKLNINEGYVYEVFENAKDLIEEKIQKFDDKIEELNKKISDAQNEKLKDVSELRMIYILKFFELVIAKNSYSVFGISLKNEKCIIENLITDEFFDLFKNESDIIFYYSQYNTTESSISFDKIEKAVDKIKYSERLEVVLNKQTENLNAIKSDLQDFENRKKELNLKKLHEILDRNNSEGYFEKYNNENKKLNNFKLINYLLSEGYINEDYNHYVSYFHPGSITKDDNDFLLSLLSTEKPLPFTHKLNELNNLIKRIKPENYSKEAILNLDLVDYLIENKITSKFNSIINLVSKENEKSIKFIDDYLNYANQNNKAIFFKTLFNNWNEFWNYIITKSNFTSDKIEIYLRYIFKYLDLTTINSIDKKSKLSNYISELNNLDCFYEIEINIENLKAFLKNSSVEFENLSYDEQHQTLFEFIYDNNIYAINEKMIELFISNFNDKKVEINNLKTSNYTTIKNSGKLKLIKYIDNNIDIYLEDVFLKLENNNNESEENILSILNNVGSEIYQEVIENAKFLISDLSKINDIKIQSKLIIEQKININWKNLIAYYKKSKEMDETITGYLNLEQNYNALSKIRIEDTDASIKSSFSKDLIKCDISDESYSKLINSLPFYYKDGSEFIEINNSKMKLLIDLKTIPLSTQNYNMLNDEFDDLLIFLLEKNAVNFVKTFQEYTLDSSIILSILNSSVFNQSQKLLIIENTTDDILIGSKNLLIKLSEFLLANKTNKISSILLVELISNSKSTKQRVELTNQYFNFIEKSYLSPIIKKIEEFSKLLIGKYPKVDNTKWNQQLILNLEGTLISNKKVSKDNKQIELFPYKKSRV